MSVLNHIKNIAFPLMVFGFLAVCVGLSSCREETGCTSRTADNYNPDAVRDDGSCINARDKFLGVYDILWINWEDSLPNHLNTTKRYMTIAEDNLREAEDDVKILNFGEDSITVRALVDKHYLTIPTQSLSVRGTAMTFRGEGHIDDQGYLTILYSVWLASNQQLIQEDVVIFGQRWDN